MKRGIKYVISVTLITVFVLAIGGVLWSLEPPPLVLQHESPNPSETESSNPPESDWRRGATDAVIRIDVYVDWGCSSCVEGEFVVSQVIRYYYAQLAFTILTRQQNISWQSPGR
jgi:hypothetical protein